jgi:hypothetical protein
MQTINETKGWFFEKINKIDKPQENLTKIRVKRPKVVKSELKKGDNYKNHGNPGNHQRLL